MDAKRPESQVNLINAKIKRNEQMGNMGGYVFGIVFLWLSLSSGQYNLILYLNKFLLEHDYH